MTDTKEDAVPADISFEGEVMCIDAHPSRPLLATGCINGRVHLHRYSVKENQRQWVKGHHKHSCRALRFSPEGGRLYTAGKDKSLWCVDVETGCIRRKIKSAHEDAIYCMTVTGERFVATGDDEGHIKVWDMRQKRTVFELKECDDFISDMIVDDDHRTLLATSGDGTLTAINIRGKKLDHQSELHDSELLSLCWVKGQQKVVCGSGDGALYLFNRGEWGNMSDRFPGHPDSISCIVPLSEDVICTGSSSDATCGTGYIRAVNILPNRFLGIVGQHQFDVEGLALSHDRRLLLSCSHDTCVKFWDVRDVLKVKVNATKKAKSSTKAQKLGTAKKRDFFAGLSEQLGETSAKVEDGDSDSGESEDEDSDSDSE